MSSYVLRRTTERALLIISEAVKALPDELLARYPKIPWASIRGIGNLLRHDYSSVDDSVIWDVTTRHLADLDEAVRGLIAASDGRDPDRR